MNQCSWRCETWAVLTQGRRDVLDTKAMEWGSVTLPRLPLGHRNNYTISLPPAQAVFFFFPKDCVCSEHSDHAFSSGNSFCPFSSKHCGPSQHFHSHPKACGVEFLPSSWRHCCENLTQLPGKFFWSLKAFTRLLWVTGTVTKAGKGDQTPHSWQWLQ